MVGVMKEMINTWWEMTHAIISLLIVMTCAVISLDRYDLIMQSYHSFDMTYAVISLVSDANAHILVEIYFVVVHSFLLTSVTKRLAGQSFS